MFYRFIALVAFLLAYTPAFTSTDFDMDQIKEGTALSHAKRGRGEDADPGEKSAKQSKSESHSTNAGAGAGAGDGPTESSLEDFMREAIEASEELFGPPDSRENSVFLGLPTYGMGEVFSMLGSNEIKHVTELLRESPAFLAPRRQAQRSSVNQLGIYKILVKRFIADDADSEIPTLSFEELSTFSDTNFPIHVKNPTRAQLDENPVIRKNIWVLSFSSLEAIKKVFPSVETISDFPGGFSKFFPNLKVIRFDEGAVEDEEFLTDPLVYPLFSALQGLSVLFRHDIRAAISVTDSSTPITSLQALSAIKNLVFLTFTHGALKLENLADRSLKPLTQHPLEELDLERNFLAEDGDNFLEQLRPLSTTLRTLSIGANDLCEVGTIHTLEPLLSFPHLKVLSVHSNGLGRLGAEGLRPLTDLPTQHLDLGYNELHRMALEDLRILKNLTRLESLSLSGNELATLGPDPLSLLPEGTRLETLELSDNRIGEVDVPVDIFKPLERCLRLTTLNLEENNLGAIRLEALQGLSRLPSLRELNLVSTHIEGLGRDGLEAISAIPSLTALYLQRNDLGSLGFEDLEPFSKMKKIEDLRLSNNNLHHNYLAFQHFSSLTTLVRLDLGHNHLGIIMSNVLWPLSDINLKRLSLFGNDLFRTHQHNLRTLSEMTSLVELHISINGLTDADAQPLKFIPRLYY